MNAVDELVSGEVSDETLNWCGFLEWMFVSFGLFCTDPVYLHYSLSASSLVLISGQPDRPGTNRQAMWSFCLAFLIRFIFTFPLTHFFFLEDVETVIIINQPYKLPIQRDEQVESVYRWSTMTTDRSQNPAP